MQRKTKASGSSPQLSAQTEAPNVNDYARVVGRNFSTFGGPRAEPGTIFVLGAS